MTKIRLKDYNRNLLKEVNRDFEFYGEDFSVYAIYSYVEAYDFEFISDYVYADKPEPESLLVDEYKKVLADWEEDMKRLEKAKHRKMTLDDLRLLLSDQQEKLE